MPVNPNVVQIELKFFTPALQQAMKQAQDSGHNFRDAVMGATNAHLNMLVELVGTKEAKAILKGQIAFLETQPSDE